MRRWLWPLLAYLGLMVPIAWLDIDRQWAGFWFRLQGNEWQLKHHWLTQTLLHDRGHDLALGLYLLVVFLYLGSFFVRRLQVYRPGLSYLSLSMPVATLAVSLMKRLTFVDCPWSVIDFDGARPYQFWLQSLWSPLTGADHCFPAGHASSAYMFFGLYFFSCHFRPQQARQVLAAVIACGLIFGVAQQLRGAHFVSHDLTSALICWYVTYGLWRYWHIPNPPVPARA